MLVNSDSMIYGDITSIAIEESYRNQGIGTALMTQIHSQFAFYYPKISYISLFCRQSNEIAINHYINRYGYEINEKIKNLYSDGEDGYNLRLNEFPRCLNIQRFDRNGNEIIDRSKKQVILSLKKEND